MRHRGMTIGLLAATVALLLFPSLAHAQGLMPIHRFYNSRSGVHFYTANEGEKQAVQTQLASTYRYEGVAYSVSATPTPYPVFRFMNVRNGVHFYTACQSERDAVVADLLSPLQYEGIAFYIAGSVPVAPPIPAPTPVWQRFKGLKIEGVQTSNKVIAMDFDDGPSNYKTITEIFEKYGGKPTFFWVGNRVTTSAGQYAAAHGLEVDSHSWSHSSLSTMSDSEKLSQIDQADARITQLVGKKPLWFRAPYNDASSSLLSLLASRQHLYADQYLMTRDYTGLSSSQLIQMFDTPKPGAIYLFHEGTSNTVAALPTILANLKKKGYRVVTNTELLRYGTPTSF